MDKNGKLSSKDTSALVDEKKYKKLVGSLIFLCNTRLDLCYVVGVLTHFSNLPWQNHWQARMRLLKYLKGTLEYGITYGKGSTLIGFCNSDWAGDSDSRKSVSGYCFTLGSGVLSWISKKQPTMAQSSTEAEYKAACFGACEAVWLRRIFFDLGFLPLGPTLLKCDSQSCIAITKNPVFHVHTKLIGGGKSQTGGR